VRDVRALTAFAAVALFSLSAACNKKTATIPAPPAPQQQQATTEVKTPPAQVAKAAPAAPHASANSRYPDAATVRHINELLARIQDVYFDYDKHFLRQDARQGLLDDSKALAEILKQYPDYKLTVEGHCDERGSDEYNLALGDARAKAAREYLGDLGIPTNQLQIISYGKEHPQCSDHEESCWQKNRRAHFVAMAN
jgi:peptidoglycan-associated lipoprotein